ncbi:MAG: hypothetical protein HY817_03240 [Candidatus Abawacabacteria bacterium]|nr:hypothetical protein [Candidatus Abawacabacteria bacterium]
MAQLPFARYSKGFVSLINVLAVTGIGATIVISLLWLALGSSDNHLLLLRSMQARNAATACAEVALQEIQNTTTYSGTYSLTINDIECSYTVTIGTGEEREVTASSTHNGVTRKIEIEITQINPTIIISSWQEVADF